MQKIVNDANAKNACIVNDAAESDDGSWVEVMEEQKEHSTEDEHELLLMPEESPDINNFVPDADGTNHHRTNPVVSNDNHADPIEISDRVAVSSTTASTQDLTMDTDAVGGVASSRPANDDNETETLRTIEVTENTKDGTLLVDDKEIPASSGDGGTNCRGGKFASDLFNEIGKTSQKIVEESARIKERSQDVIKFVEGTVQNVGKKAKHVGDEAKKVYRDQEVDLRVKVAAEKAKRGLQTTAEKARRFDEKYHATETIASAAVIAAAAFFSRGNLRTGASVITVAAAAAGIGEGLRASKNDHTNNSNNHGSKMPY